MDVRKGQRRGRWHRLQQRSMPRAALRTVSVSVSKAAAWSLAPTTAKEHAMCMHCSTSPTAWSLAPPTARGHAMSSCCSTSPTTLLLESISVSRAAVYRWRCSTSPRRESLVQSRFRGRRRRRWDRPQRRSMPRTGTEHQPHCADALYNLGSGQHSGRWHSLHPLLERAAKMNEDTWS
jgi:hypothetical protein